MTLNPGEEHHQRSRSRSPSLVAEDPFLYVVESSTGGDSLQTRFGMGSLFRRRHEARLPEWQGLLPARLEHPCTVSSKTRSARICPERLGAQAARDLPKMHWNSFGLHRPGAGPLVRHLRRSGFADSKRVFIWTGPRVVFRNKLLAHARRGRDDSIRTDARQRNHRAWPLGTRRTKPRGHLRQQDHSGRAFAGPIGSSVGKQLRRTGRPTIVGIPCVSYVRSTAS